MACRLGTSLLQWPSEAGAAKPLLWGTTSQGPQGPRPRPPLAPLPEAPPPCPLVPEAPPPRAPPGPGTRPPVAPHKQAGCGAATQGLSEARGPQNTLACACRCPALGTAGVEGRGCERAARPQVRCELGRRQDGPWERRHQADARGWPFSRHPPRTVRPAPGSLARSLSATGHEAPCAPETWVSLQAACGCGQNPLGGHGA